MSSQRERSRSVVHKSVLALLSQNDDDTPSVFCQLDCLTKNKNDEVIWQESARWVKYEEDVEDNGKRWSKPHVSSIALSNVFELRSRLNKGVIILDADVHSVRQLTGILLDHLSKTALLDRHIRDTIRVILMTRHIHNHQGRKSKSSDVGKHMPVKIQYTLPKTCSSADLMKERQRQSVTEINYPDKEKTETSNVKVKKSFLKKIPNGAEAANLWVGEIQDFKQPITVLIRLAETRVFTNLTEVPLPSRFIFIHLTPPGTPNLTFEIGRTMANMLIDEIFSEVAYKAQKREDIMNGFEEFLDNITALPPGQWDPEIRIEPPSKVPPQDIRKKSTKVKFEEIPEEDEDDTSLLRTGRLFGGLVQDVKRKLPFYLSDFKDGIHIQCLATILYMYLATLTPNITFGALLGQSTDLYMGTMECIVTMAFVNLAWSLCSGQPLIMMGSTGPLLVLEIIIYQMCRDNDWEFLPFRLYVGLWCALMLMIIVAFDLSAMVRYITRFTEESFACLIALIFIVEAVSKIFKVAKTNPFNIHPEIPLDYTCYCVQRNETFQNMTSIVMVVADEILTNRYSFNTTIAEMSNWTSITATECQEMGGVVKGRGCTTPIYHDNVFFFSLIIGFGTFMIAWNLVKMKTSSFFPTFVRQILGDFAVFLSVCLMVALDAIIGVQTNKLSVPDKIQPSRPDRGWFVTPYSERNPWWTMLVTALPALVAVILIFMDQQITAVIINRKDNKLKKESGYHLDLFVCTICLVVCSFFGLPWFVAATVRSMAHINSLKLESECTAPGEKPVFLGCREQRVTALLIAILNGCSVFMTKILQLVPMPVLYGVFLYMGVSGLKGMQFVDRILIMFMPAKYQPDYMYLRHVRIKRVHIFTIIQILCLAVLWVIKAIKTISIVFPVMVLGTCFVRKGMEKFFTRNELKWLDELMPEEKMRKLEDAGELSLDEEDEEDIESDNDTSNDSSTPRILVQSPSSDSVTRNTRLNGTNKRNGPGEFKFLLGDNYIQCDNDTNV